MYLKRKCDFTMVRLCINYDIVGVYGLVYGRRITVAAGWGRC